MGFDGTLIFDTAIDQGGFNKGISTLKTVAQGGIASIGSVLSFAAIAAGVASVSSASVKAASDLQEVQNVVDVTFGPEGARKVDSWAKAAVNAYGLSELAAKKYAGYMGSMFKSMGVSEVEEMSTGIAALTGDFSSFFNVTSEEAFTVLKSAISGETEAIKRFGVGMQVANLEAFALSSGMKKSYEDMSQAEKATLRYQYIMQALSHVMGDYTRTADQFANTQRSASLAVESVAVAIGRQLLPIATRGMKGIKDFAQDLAKNIGEQGLSGIFRTLSERAPVLNAALAGSAAAFGALMIIRQVMAIMKAYAAVRASLTALEVAGTVTEWASIGALSVKQAVVGLLTGKLTLAAAAQAIFNAVVSANPVMLFVIAIGALVGAISLMVSGLRKTEPELFAVGDAIKEVKKQNDALKSSMAASAAQYAETSDEVEKQAATAYALVDALAELSAEYTGSNLEQAKMDQIVADLNASYSDLSLSYDRNTGALSKNAGAIRDVIAARKEEAKAAAAMSRYTELIGEQVDAQFALKQAQDAFNLAVDNGATKFHYTYDKAAAAVKKAEENVTAANQAVSDFDSFMTSAGIVVQKTTAAVDDATGAMDDLGDAEERVVIAGHDVTDMLKRSGMTADDAAERLGEYTSVAMNMFDRINTKSDVSVKKMIENWKHNIGAVEDWGKNIEKLGGKLPEQLLSALVAEGPEKMAGAISALAAATPAQLEEIQAMFAEGGSAAAAAWLASLGAGVQQGLPGASKIPQVTAADIAKYGSKAEALDALLKGSGKKDKTGTEKDTAAAAAAAVDEAKQAVDAAVAEADFGGIGTTIASSLVQGFILVKPALIGAGQSLVEGVMLGVAAKEPELLAQMRRLGAAAVAAFNAGARISSPSKDTMISGDMLVLGVVLRVRAGIDQVKKAMSDLAGTAVSELAGMNYAPSTAVSGAAAAAAASGIRAVPDSVKGAAATAAKAAATVIESQHNGIEHFEPHYHVPVESPAQLSQRTLDDAAAAFHTRL